jgi:hypothetical protein
MLLRLVNEPRAIPDFHGGMLGIGAQFIGACRRQIVRPAFDEKICRSMIGYGSWTWPLLLARRAHDKRHSLSQCHTRLSV